MNSNKARGYGREEVQYFVPSLIQEPLPWGDLDVFQEFCPIKKCFPKSIVVPCVSCTPTCGVSNQMLPSTKILSTDEHAKLIIKLINQISVGLFAYWNCRNNMKLLSYESGHVICEVVDMREVYPITISIKIFSDESKTLS